MTLERSTCAFCQKEMVMPCTFSGQSEYCNQRAAAMVALTELANSSTAPMTATEVKQTTDQATAEVAQAFTPDEAVALLRKATTAPPPKPTDVQIGGDHYKTMAIQPLTFIQANKIGFEEGNVIKYVSRWRAKGGVEDLKKARDVLDKKIAFEEAHAQTGLMEYLSALFKSV